MTHLTIGSVGGVRHNSKCATTFGISNFFAGDCDPYTPLFSTHPYFYPLKVKRSGAIERESLLTASNRRFGAPQLRHNPPVLRHNPPHLRHNSPVCATTFPPLPHRGMWNGAFPTSLPENSCGALFPRRGHCLQGSRE